MDRNDTPAKTAAETPPVIAARSVSVSYGGIPAVRDVSISLNAGEIHALLGGNGAGKSTLIKSLTGAVTPEAGQILLDGTPVHFSHPNQAIAAGVRVVYQELSLFPALTVTENVLGPAGLGTWVSWRRAHSAAADALRTFGLDVDPRRRVADLTLGQQQMVEIVRAVRSGGRVVVLDEPTSALGHEQADALFELVHALAQAGIAILFVSQDFNDALRHADVISVMREGWMSDPQPRDEATADTLIRLTFGEGHGILESTYETGRVRLPSPRETPIVLKVDGLQCVPHVVEFSLEARAGEILGIFGSLDSGHMAFAEAVFGTRRRDHGVVLVNGRKVEASNPHAAVRAGIGYVSADRREALALTHRIDHNVTLASVRSISRWFVRGHKEAEATQELIERLSIRSAEPAALVEHLSGGNQQKVLFSRWMLVDPSVLVLVEPTRGMDIAAKSDVIRIVKARAAAGTAVLVISSEPETILSVADRILVAQKGTLVKEFVDQDVSLVSLTAAA